MSTLVRFFLITLVLALTSPVASQSTAQNQSTRLQFAEDSEVTVSGTSTVHDWSCTASSVSGTLELGSGSGSAASRIRTGTVTIPVEALECTRSRMNDNTWEALEYEDHPEIRFELRSATAAADSAGWTLLDAAGDLTVAGTTESVEMRARARADEEGPIHIRGETNLTMTMFGVEPPTALFGTIRAEDRVTVRYDVRLRPAGGASASR